LPTHQWGNEIGTVHSVPKSSVSMRGTGSNGLLAQEDQHQAKDREGQGGRDQIQ